LLYSIPLGVTCPYPPGAEHRALRDAGRDEDFKVATDSEAAPVAASLLAALSA